MRAWIFLSHLYSKIIYAVCHKIGIISEIGMCLLHILNVYIILYNAVVTLLFGVLTYIFALFREDIRRSQ